MTGTEKKNMLFATIGISAIIIIIGFYIWFIQKNVTLLVTALVVIELFVALITEISGIFKDRLNKKEKELAKFLDVQKLKNIRLAT